MADQGEELSNVLVVPFGQIAKHVLALQVERAKAGDPLAPVTVVTPSNFAGLQLRRELAQAPGGLVNVRFLVLPRLAELLGAPLLTARGKSPLTPWLQHAAIRSALAGMTTDLGAAADHPSTPLSLATTFRDLRQAPEGFGEVLREREGHSAEIAAIYERFRRLTGNTYDAEDLANAAADAVNAGTEALRDVGIVIFFLPRPFSPAGVKLLQALRRRNRALLILGATGDLGVDEPLRALLANLNETALVPLVDLAPEQGGDDPDVRIAIAVDVEEEARLAVRLVAEAMREGTALHRIAVLHALPEQGSLLREQFRAGEIPCNGAAERTLAQSAVGRTLLGLYELAKDGADGFRRDEVMRWLTQAPIVEPGGKAGHPTPAASWDAISRKAGVLLGAGQWQQRLGAWMERPRRKGGPADWERDYAERLRAFIARLETDLRVLAPGATAAEHAAHALSLLERYLGTEAHVGSWRGTPEELGKDSELEAYRAIKHLVDEIGRTSEAARQLDFIARLEPRAARSAFVEALTALLERPGASSGRFGDGAFLAPPSAAAGMTFDLVIFVGMAEGAMPPASREDPLLPDEAREAAQIPLRQAQRNEARRDYLAARRSAKGCVLSYARSTAGQQGKQHPSPWLLAEASRLAGPQLSGECLERLRSDENPWLIAPASFEASLRDQRMEPASAQEFELRSLLRSSVPPQAHYLAGEGGLRNALVAATVRLPNWLARQPLPAEAAWDGKIGPDTRIAPWIGDGSEGTPTISPTDLETFAECPYRFFLRRVLRVEEFEAPEERLGLEPKERGNIIHECLDEFFGKMPRHAPGDRWSEEERARLQALAEEQFQEKEAAGLAGARLTWEGDRERIRRELDLTLSQDEKRRQEQSATFEHAEQRFGRKRSPEEKPWPPAIVELADGRRVLLAGQVDRVDTTPDGYLVYDYKSGGTRGFTDIAKGKGADPLVRGKKLQLAVYALAARQAKAPRQAERVEAAYWFVNEAEHFRLIGYEFDERVEARFHEVIETVAASVEAGQFPQAAGKNDTRTNKPENCTYCAYDRVCPGSGRAERWRDRSHDPELRPLAALINGPEAEEPGNE